MKINIIPRLMDAVSSGKSFEEQLAVAEASGRPFGRVSDMQFGKHIIYSTDEEIAGAQIRTAAERARPQIPSQMESLEARVRALEAKLVQFI